MSETPKRIEPDALYSCCICSDEYSWSKEDLRWHNNALWCCNCFSEYGEDDASWGDLEAFIPKSDRELAEARAEVERLRAVFEHRKAIMLEIADSLENNKLTDEEEYEDELIESLRSNAEEKAALSAAERGEQ